MPRAARICVEDGVFHILAKGNNKQKIFEDESDYNVYKNILKKLKEEQPFNLYHWCLMSNHVHMIIETNEKTKLSKMMKRLGLFYYSCYKKKYGYAGHFWQDRFKSLLIDKDEYLLACGLYIERNPVRARIVKSAKDYLHSSYNYYAYGREDGLTDLDPLYAGLGRTLKEREITYRNLTVDIEKNISGAMFGQLFLGKEDFMKKMENKFKVRNVRLGKGRPRKEK